MKNSRVNVNGICLPVALVCLFGGLSCGPRLMLRTTPVESSPSDRALVTFVRPATWGGNLEFSLWDGDRFIGNIEWKEYIQVALPPGEHFFMAKSKNRSYLKATLQAGKKYVVIVKVAKSRYTPVPVLMPMSKNQTQWGQADIHYWLASLDAVTPNPVAVPDWVAPRLEEIRQELPQGSYAELKAEELGPDDYWD